MNNKDDDDFKTLVSFEDTDTEITKFKKDLDDREVMNNDPVSYTHLTLPTTPYV